jgi:hypothetical protein
MFTRLTHAAIAFALTAAAYQAYVIAVTPFVEPNAMLESEARRSTPDQWRTGREAPDRYRELLTAYFPPDHWCFARPPKTFENGQALVVLDDYRQTDSGELRVPKFAIVFFPRVRDRGAPPPRDAIILEPAGGAVLQMDQRLTQGVGGLGRMQFGQLLGEVIVRSDMREAGPDDDLLITTRDLYMNEDLIRTAEAVEMRLGQHFGRGRGLEIRRVRAEETRGDALSTLFGSFDSLEISHEVSVVVAPGKLSFLGHERFNSSQHAAARAAAPAEFPGETVVKPSAKVVQTPIRIQSAGPFRIDFGNYIASFVDQVQVRQLHADGKLDELDASELNLFFTKVQQWDGGAKDDQPEASSASTGAEPAFESFALEPEWIEAKGSSEAPVRLTAPSQTATALGERLVIELTPRRVTLEGGDEVTLTYQGGEIHAPMVQYQLPPQDSPERVGTLHARGGGGRLQAVVDPKRPDQILEVTWKDAMQLVRRNGQPVLILDGRPRVSMVGLGTLYADSLELFLRESSGGAKPVERQQSSALPSNVMPERLTAAGHVVIQSAEINGRVNQLELKIDAASEAPTGGSAQNNAAPSTAALLPRQHQAGRRAYDIEGVVLKLKATMRDRRPEVTDIRVDGAVVFQESPIAGDQQPPLRIAAEHLRVSHADAPNAEIEIRGGGGQGDVPQQMAEIASRDTIIRAPQLTVNRGTSQAWVNSPGEVKMLVDRDATGKPLPTPQPLTIVWQDSMRLDTDRITFTGDVRVEHADGWLRTRRLVAQLTAPVRFDGAGGRERPELAQIECWEGALAEFGQRDPSGAVTSHERIEVQSLRVNQVTGAISGEGPGHVDSVHLSSGAQQLFKEPGAAANQAVADEPSLRHLSIDFVRNVEGNLHTPDVNVIGDVRAVYGPIGAWDERLTMDPGGRPGRHTIWITCDELGVAGSPAARAQAAAGGTNPFGQVELRARVRVVIEGDDPRQGAFTLRGHQATYDQGKTMFVLQGDGREPAVITHQQFPGSPPSDQSAQKIIYYQNTGEVVIQGVNKIQLHQFDKAARPDAGPRR